MDRLEKAFKDSYATHEGWSSFTCFATIVLNRKFSVKTIRDGFDKLVDKDDYAEDEKEKIVSDLVNRRFGKTPKVVSE
jgi:hypothetical protein